MGAYQLYEDLKKAFDGGHTGGMIIHHNFPRELMQELGTLLLKSYQLEELLKARKQRRATIRKAAAKKRKAHDLRKGNDSLWTDD